MESQKEPKLEEYGLDINSYENYRNEKISLEKELYKYEGKKYYNSAIGGVMVFLGIIFGLIAQSWIVFFLGLIIGSIIGSSQESSERLKDEQIKNGKNKSILNKIDFIRNKVSIFEDASIQYYENYLEEFFLNNLFKKRSGGEKFGEHLSEFNSMLDEAKEINKKLIFSKINLNPHKFYLLGREVNHKYQQNKKFNSFDKINIPKEEEKQIYEKEVNKIEEINENIIPPEKRYYIPRKIDWENINKNKAIMGLKGEEIVVEIERNYLNSIKREDLAEKVKHISKEEGDGAGFDILSYFDDRREKFIEVKSTIKTGGDSFYLSRNELEFMKGNKENFQIYRIFNVNDNEGIPTLRVHTAIDILNSNQITPIQYVVRME